MWKHLGKMWKRMMKYGMNNMGYMGMGGKMGKVFPAKCWAIPMPCEIGQFHLESRNPCALGI